MTEADELRNDGTEEKFREGRDYYFENGLMVLTREFLLKRGHCCGSGCRNCPYEDDVKGNLK